MLFGVILVFLGSLWYFWGSHRVERAGEELGAGEWSVSRLGVTTYCIFYVFSVSVLLIYQTVQMF